MVVCSTELIITSGGENIPPIIIEDAILKEIPFLSNVMVVGDKRKFLSCLMTLKVCNTGRFQLIITPALPFSKEVWVIKSACL